MNIKNAKEMNFLPARIILERRRKKNKQLMVMGVFMATVVLVLSFWIPHKIEKRYLGKIGELEDELTLLQQSDDIYNLLVNKQKELERNVSTVNSLEDSAMFMVLPFVQRISEQLPAGAYITNLSVRPEQGADISFYTPGPVKTAEIVVGLRRLDYFESVNLSVVPLAQEAKTIQFKLQFKGTENNLQNVEQDDIIMDKGAEIDAAIREAEIKINPQ